MGVRAVITIINGFTQGVDPRDGLFAYYWDIYHHGYTRDDVFVMHLAEDADMGQAAALIARHEPLHLYAVAFSLGAGRGLDNLAPALFDRMPGLPIHAFLIDPVQDNNWSGWANTLNWLRPAALGWFSWLGVELVYQLPPNVMEARVWRQVNHEKFTQPVGHRVTASNPNTLLHPEAVYGSHTNLLKLAGDVPLLCLRVDPDVTHSTIDGDPRIRREVLDLLYADIAAIPHPPKPDQPRNPEPAP